MVARIGTFSSSSGIKSSGITRDKKLVRDNSKKYLEKFREYRSRKPWKRSVKNAQRIGNKPETSNKIAGNQSAKDLESY